MDDAQPADLVVMDDDASPRAGVALRVTADLDAGHEHLARRQLTAWCRAVAPRAVTVRIGPDRFVDVRGLSVLLDAVAAAPGRLLVEEAPRSLLRMLDVLGLDLPAVAHHLPAVPPHLVPRAVQIRGLARHGAAALAVDDVSVSLLVGDRLVAGASSGAAGRGLGRGERRHGHGPAHQVVHDRRAVAVADLRCRADWEDLAAWVAPHGVRSVLAVPFGREGRPVGVLCAVRSAPHGWLDSEVAGASAFAALVGHLLALPTTTAPTPPAGPDDHRGAVR